MRVTPFVLALAAVLAGSLLARLATADDTDIYVDNDRAARTESKPLVMLSLDYRSNLSAAANAASEQYFRDRGFAAQIDELKAISGGQWTFFDVLILSLEVVFRDLDGVRVGLMMSHNETSAATGPGSDGGAILQGFRDLADPGNREALFERLTALRRLKPAAASPDHPYQGAQLFHELFRYLTGQAIYRGHHGLYDFESGAARDAASNMRCGDPDAALASACWDPAIEADGRYRSPLADADACARLFTVNLLFQVSQQDDDAGMFTRALPDGGLGRPAPSTQNGYFPAMLDFLRGTDLADGTHGGAPALAGLQNVTSFFLVDPRFINETTRAYAERGGSGAPLALSSDPAALIATLRGVFQQILGLSTTLVAASVPINAFNRAEIVDSVYFALFQAQGAQEAMNVAPGGPVFWPGNLKKLRLREPQAPETARSVVDALGQPAILAGDGRIAPGALSFWTDPRAALLDRGDVNGDGEVDATDGPDADADADGALPPAVPGQSPADPAGISPDRDGRYVTRGGAGQRIPGFASGAPGDANPPPGATPQHAGPRRVLYLDASASGAALAPLQVAAARSSAGAALKAQFGGPTMSDAALEALIRYTRGQDVHDEDGDRDRSESRFWLLGDPLHSRPLPINYGAAAGHGDATNPAIFIAMAANDGALHFFRDTGPGGQSDAPSDSAATPGQLGQEAWAFFPPEGLAVQRQLMDRDATRAPAHPYAFDGEPSALVLDQDGDGTIEAGDQVVLYVGLRRGGSGTSSATIESAYYAIDVTDPLQPRLLWRITPRSRTTAGGVTATGDFAELGYSFSRPRVGSVQDGRRRRLAVFFGGGYDGGYTGARDASGRPLRFGKDRDGVMADDARGRAVFVVRASDGALIWKAVGGASTSGETALSTRTFVHAGLRDSVPSTLALFDADSDGAVDRLVFGDTGGNVWRADLGGDGDGDGETLDDWKLTRLACLGRHGGEDCAGPSVRGDDRRFFHEPDLVPARDENGVRYDAVVLGSGDREDPLDQGGDVDNYLYVIRDYNVGIGSGAEAARPHAALTDVTAQCLGSGDCPVAPHGWRLLLGHGDGEKALSAPLTIAGTVFFTTYVPPPAAPSRPSCGPREGSGFLYAIRLEDGSPRYNYDTSDGGARTDPGRTASDRSIDLQSQGIPAQVVYLGPAARDTGGCVANVLAGARVFEAEGCPRFRTFWQRVGS